MRFHRITLRAIFVILTIASVPCAYIAWKRRTVQVSIESAAFLREEGARFGSDRIRTFALGIDLGERTELHNLFWSNLPIDDAKLARVACFSEIKEVHLNNLEITNSGLRHLKQMRQLRLLDLGGNKIGGKGLVAVICNFTQLESLDLARTDIDDDDIAHLAELRKLKFISVAGTKVSNKCLSSLASIKSLEAIDLSSTNITFDGLSALRSLEKLESLQLEHTSVSSDQEASFWILRSSNPAR